MTSDTATLGSPEQLQAHKHAAAMLDTTLSMANTLAGLINNLIKTKKKAPLLDLLSGLDSVERVLLYLKESVQSEASVDECAATLKSLRDPSGSWGYLLNTVISAFEPSRDPRKRILGQTANNIDVMDIKRKCENQKILLLSALRKDHRYVRTQLSTVLSRLQTVDSCLNQSRTCPFQESMSKKVKPSLCSL